MVGPSTMLPDRLILIACGLLFSGVFIVFCTVLQIPIMLELAEHKYPSQSLKASDYWPSIYNAVLSIGMLIGPVYGGHMTEIVGYRTSWDIMAIILITYSLVFYFSILLCSKTEVPMKSQEKLVEEDKTLSRNDVYASRNTLMAKVPN